MYEILRTKQNLQSILCQTEVDAETIKLDF